MAGESENSVKPKAELIKQAQPKQEAEPEKTAASEQGKRRKIVIKKTASAGQNKKPQPKIIVATPHGDVAAETASKEKKTAPESPPPEAKKGAASESGAVTPDEKNAITPPAPKVVTTFQIAQRPAVVRGKVGGRQSGPRNPDGRRGQQPPRRQEGNAPKPEGREGRGNGQPRQAGGNVGNGRGNRNGTGPNRHRRGGEGQQRPPNQRGNGGPRPNNFGAQRQGGRPGPHNIVGQKPAQGMNAPSTSAPVDNKTPAKRSFKAKKPVYIKRDKETEREEKLHQTKKKIVHPTKQVPKSIDIMESISVAELARKMSLKAADLIAKLIGMGMMVTINQQIDSDTATLLAAEYGTEVKIINLYDETVIASKIDKDEDMEPRPPVVTVMGHVDHGKTKLLDAIRSTDKVAAEFGGITQHIGAYTVETENHHKITFLDTPGHEAFTRMRARGAQVTDIVVLVVAADDGVMPQTVEAINHAKEAGVPIIVAVNKIDKPDANPDRVKTQLSELELQPEEWGGQTMFVEISALKKQGINDLIDRILLQAEILELKANFNRDAEGKVLESRIDPGRGTVATVLVEKGTLKIGDSFVAGIYPGRVRALYNDKGKKVNEAGPAVPIEVTGFDEGIPNAGDPFQVVEDERFARDISAKRKELKRFEDAKNVKKITLENLHDTISEGAIQELKVIIKSDVQGSAEALRSSLERLSTKDIRLNVIQALPGAINEGDVELAIASKAILIGFNVRPVPKAKTLAEQEKVDIRKYNIIFKAVEEMREAMEGLLLPDMKEETLGTLEVRTIFKTTKYGTIAGCFVLNGMIKRSASVHVIRDNVEIFTGKIASLRRFKDDVKEVAESFECGLGVENFNDIQVNDQLEAFEMVKVARKLDG
jgi:translation initiation factor IF-2